MLHIANIFQPLIDVFESVLKFFHNSIGIQWGWAIVLLTVCVRLVLVPLSIKQIRSMQRLQSHMPELKAIQNKYKEDKQRQQQEIMKFYKENNVNPFGSCLPLVLQIPVFISLFYMLRTSLRKDICPGVQAAYHAAHPGHAGTTVPCGPHGGASFLFIPDLTNKATGAVLVVLIILYVGTQLASSLIMSSPTMDKTQRQIMLALPLFFVIFIISFPAGVIVYWITTNAWTIGQQYVVKRTIGPIGVPAAAAAETGDGRAGAAAKARTAEPAPNGAESGGLAAMLRNRLKPPEEPASVGASGRSSQRSGSSGQRSGSSGQRTGSSGQRSGPPPPPPRKKKKRSGRRR
jgi:YidC/Oxa1 family membrane protein insertase